jgi:DNA-binding beta-propeller fold protein YncE
MHVMDAQRLFARGGLALAAALVALIGFAVPSAQAERQLDPVLSLIGACAKPEALDPVEDPGCPTTPPETAHPPAGFAVPRAVATDFYGNMYVANFGKILTGSQGRIDIFSPEGVFISELKFEAPMALAIDSEGNLYVIADRESQRRLFLFAPTEYEPAAGKISYGSAPTLLTQPGSSSGSEFTGIAVNADNDHLFANYGAAKVIEYSSAEEGNAIVRMTSTLSQPHGVGIAVDATRDLLYASSGWGFTPMRIDVFDLTQVEGSPPEDHYKKVRSIEGSEVPEGSFGDLLSVAVDEGTGNVYVLDVESNRVYEFDVDGNYLSTIEPGFQVALGTEIGVDNGPFSPNGAGPTSDSGHYLFVPSGKTGTGHSYAFEESNERGPEIISTNAAGITEDEAELQASVNPGNLETEFTFEYTTQTSFEAEGFIGASTAGSGKLPAGNLDDEAAAVADDLEPGTAYRFRVVVSNDKGSDEAEGIFTTFPTQPSGPDTCGNHLVRVGLSALLPDCRAFELVTPADTNGRAPLGTGRERWFTTRQVSPDGNKVPFRVEGGSLPGIGGTGSYLGDPFMASRGPDGWGTDYIGPSGAEAASVMPGGTSPDQGYSFFAAEREGSAVIEGKSTAYLRFPDGHAELLGVGSIGTDPEANGFLISEDGEHVIFGTGAIASDSSAVQLEPEAPPSGTRAIYDRTPDGVLHVVSLKPGNIPLTGSEKGVYEGASLDGRGVAFKVNSKTLYLRYDNIETYEVGEDVKFAGIAEGGSQIFYTDGEQLWRFDALTGDRTPFSSGPVTPVIVSPDGSAAYFISTSKLSSEPNPNGAGPQAGKQNLYLSREGEIQFVATVTERDVVGKKGAVEQVDGLGLWMDSIAEPTPGRLGKDPSRTTPDGAVLLFQSRAPLAGYDPEGHSEIYRYDSVGAQLQCLSCNPTGQAATADDTLQSEGREGFALFFPQAWIQNLRPDGRRAIFQSLEALVPGDNDGRQDVYQWEAEGVGSCAQAEGCVSLISSGHSPRNDYLWAVSESGNDVFFLSSDLLLPSDLDQTPSIYDARVGGGFAEPGSAECQGEGCRPQLSPPPAIPGVQTPVQGAGDNVKTLRCGKGKHKVKRNGKVRCVKKKKHHKKAARSRTGSEQKGGRK